MWVCKDRTMSGSIAESWDCIKITSSSSWCSYSRWWQAWLSVTASRRPRLRRTSKQYENNWEMLDCEFEASVHYERFSPFSSMIVSNVPLLDMEVASKHTHTLLTAHTSFSLIASSRVLSCQSNHPDDFSTTLWTHNRSGKSWDKKDLWKLIWSIHNS